MARLKAQVVEESALATNSSSSERASRGIRAERPGSKRAHIRVSRSSSSQTSQTMSADRTSNMESTIAARQMSAKIITERRERRSFNTPAMGAAKTCGRSCSDTAVPTAAALPVSSSSREYKATV